MKYKIILFTILTFGFLVLTGIGNTNAQTQRNPVLEECTGTWCQWCPCGHEIMAQIKANMPNAILIGYHGPPGSSDPWDDFSGNEIIGLMTFSGYPTAVIDRTGPPISRGAWASTMNNRYNVPATVSIDIDKSFNKITGELTGTVHVTALEDLTGSFKMTIILLEDGLLHSQTGNSSCTGGGSEYVHNHVVRAIINGAQGEELNGGNPWNTSEVISKDVQYIVPVEVVPDSCHLVVIVNKVGGSFNASEIQQAEEWTLVSPDYVGTMTSTSPDAIADNNTPVQFSTTLKNEGLLDDVYYINPVLDGPAGWTGEYTTVNGTSSFGDMDSVMVAVGDSTTIDVTINPNGTDGFGETQVVFTSKNDPGVTGFALLRNVTTTGVEILVVDDTGEGFGDVVTTSLDNISQTSYGIVSSAAVNSTIDLSNYVIISWSVGESFPVFNQEEVTSLQNYLDAGGSLFISGQDIGSDIFEPTGQSQFAQSFYNNYLHASYVANAGPSFLLKGYDGDPISNGLLFVIADVYDRSADVISPFDADATPIFDFLNNPEVNSIRVSTETNRIIYMGIGFEQVGTAAAQDSILARAIRWLTPAVGVGNEIAEPLSFALNQNYPNPFNPSTRITYSVREESPVSIKVFDMIGQEVITLVDEVKKAGTYSVNFSADKLSSGVYIYQMKAGSFISAKKMSILK